MIFVTVNIQNVSNSAPLVSGIINNALFHSSPNMNQTLPHVIQILHFRPMDSLLKCTPDFVIGYSKENLKIHTGVSLPPLPPIPFFPSPAFHSSPLPSYIPLPLEVGLLKSS